MQRDGYMFLPAEEVVFEADADLVELYGISQCETVHNDRMGIVAYFIRE